MIKELIGILLGIALLMSGIISIGAKLDEAACKEKYSSYGVPTYTLLSGCMIDTIEGKRIPATAIREVGELLSEP